MRVIARISRAARAILAMDYGKAVTIMQQSGHQEIHCCVHSCKHQDKGHCVLRAIQVDAVPGKASATPEESMCGSYECRG